MEMFTLMHKNSPIATIQIKQDANGNGYLHVDKILHEEHLPYGAKNSTGDRLDMMLTWWNDSRCIPLGRPNYDSILDLVHGQTTSDLVPYSYMCSLTDCYWFRPEGLDVRWEDINFRKNGFSSEVYKRLFFDNMNEPITNLNSPDITTNGALPKMWYEKDGEFFLVKSSKTQYPMDVYNEIIASEVFRQIGAEYVKYNYDTYANIEASVCKCFIDNDNIEFVSAEDLILDGYYDGPTDYLSAMKNFGHSNSVNMMILGDMIIGNIDRHERNYGQIISSNDQSVIKSGPIFDNGGSDMLRCVDKYIYKPTNKTFDETMQLLDSETLLLAEKIDLTKIRMLMDSMPMQETTKQCILENLNNRIERALEIGRGKEHDFDREQR